MLPIPLPGDTEAKLHQLFSALRPYTSTSAPSLSLAVIAVSIPLVLLVHAGIKCLVRRRTLLSSAEWIPIYALVVESELNLREFWFIISGQSIFAFPTTVDRFEPCEMGRCGHIIPQHIFDNLKSVPKAWQAQTQPILGIFTAFLKLSP